MKNNTLDNAFLIQCFLTISSYQLCKKKKTFFLWITIFEWMELVEKLLIEIIRILFKCEHF